MAGTSTATLRYVRPLIFLVAIPLLLFIALYDSNIDAPIDLFHEGEALAPASENLRGKLPFRDIYLQHGWGVNLLRTRLAFSLFGVSVAANRKLAYGDVSGYLIPLAWIAVYLLLYALFRRKIWIMPAFVLLALADVLINDRHLLLMLSLALLATDKKGSRWPLFLAGMLAAVGVFYSLDTGLYAAAIGAAFIVLSSIGDRAQSKKSFRKSAIAYAVGAFAGALPFIAYLMGRGILDDFFFNSYLQLKYQTETWGIPLPSLMSLFGPFDSTTARNRAIYLVVKWYYPAMIYACMCAILTPKLMHRRLEKEDTALLLATLAGLVLFRSAAGRADEGHLMYAIAPFWILNICFIERAFLSGRGKTQERTDVHPAWLHGFQRLCFNSVSAGIVSIGLILYFGATCRNGGIATRKMRLSNWKQTQFTEYVVLSLGRSGGIRVPPQQAEEIEKTVAFITSHTQPGMPIFDFSNQGAYYFLTDRPNPTWYCQAAYATPARLQAEAVEQLKSSPPSLVLVRENEPHHPMKTQPVMYEWIRQNYSEAARIGPNIILLPLESNEIRSRIPEDTSPHSP